MVEVQAVVIWLLAIAAFFAGAFLTAVAFITGWATKIRSLEENVKFLKDKLEGWEKNGMPVCALHQGQEDRLRRVEIAGGQTRLGDK